FRGNILCWYHRPFATAAIIAQPGIFARPRADREGGNGHKNEAAGKSPPVVRSPQGRPVATGGNSLPDCRCPRRPRGEDRGPHPRGRHGVVTKRAGPGTI